MRIYVPDAILSPVAPFLRRQVITRASNPTLERARQACGLSLAANLVLITALVAVAVGWL